MKNLILLMFVLMLSGGIAAQKADCSKTSVGYPPINDLGKDFWRGFQGGLYPNGSNVRPKAHNQSGVNFASKVQPRNRAGNVDTANGKIVWLSIGMSNTTFESQAFIKFMDTFRQKNPKLVLVDGAQGGQDINIIDNPNAEYWNVVKNRLDAAGVTPKQVQVIWFKEAEKAPSDPAFANYPNSLKLKYKTAIQIIKSKFKNAKLCYMASRIYAGYASGDLNPEPYAYYSGWSVKRLIEDQINGDTSLSFAGSNARAPWLAWGPYFWADGTTPRSDGLTWNCPGDYLNDGTHPSVAGRKKVANMLLSFFSTDVTTVPWFMKKNSVSVASSISVQNRSSYFNSEIRIKVAPNPSGSEFKISMEVAKGENLSMKIYDVPGRLIAVKKLSDNITTFGSDLKPGIYFLEISNSKAKIKHLKIEKSE